MKMCKKRTKRLLKEYYEKEALGYHHQYEMYAKNNIDSWRHKSRFGIIPSFMKKVERINIFLDVGCAEGYYLHLATELYGCQCNVIGVDVAANYLKKAAKNHHENMDVIVADAEYLPLRGKCVDMVLCSGVLEHLPSALTALDEALRVSSPHIIVSFPGPRQPHGIAYPLMTQLAR